ncbi:MAG: amidohydrolase family protein [Candidatus Eisenbacteria bacterium]|nr:amidohydrolase family protein [Candidatus Eisenbacteria bacterium]
MAAVIETAAEAETAVYFVHVSSAAGLQAIREGRRRSGAPIRMETCPQYLALDDTVYSGPDGRQFIVTPPLRAAGDAAELLAAIANGEVDVVATDHCSFRRAQKEREAPFTEIPSGLPGVETRLPLLHTLTAGRMPPERLVRCLSAEPARILGLYPRKGSLTPGGDADLVLFDPQEEWEPAPEALHMETDFSPFAGMRVRGKVRRVFLRGKPVLENGVLKGPPRGRFLRRGLDESGIPE